MQTIWKSAFALIQAPSFVSKVKIMVFIKINIETSKHLVVLRVKVSVPFKILVDFNVAGLVIRVRGVTLKAFDQ